MIDVGIINKSNNLVPSYQTPGSSGMDIRASLDSPILLKPGERAVIPTGIYLNIPEGYEIQIRPRSGLAAKHGITVLNSPGTIDCLSGDTIIKLFDGTSDTLKNISDRVDNGERIFVYSVDNEWNLTSGLVTQSIYKGNLYTLLIEFENGTKIKCTRGHEFKLGNGEYKLAHELEVGMDVLSISELPDNNTWEEDNSRYFTTNTVKSIERLDDRYEMYDLNIEKYHNFLAEDVFVHNCDYQGELGVILVNLGNKDFLVNDGERIAQMVLSRYEKMNLVEMDEFSFKTERGSGGFGHSGVK